MGGKIPGSSILTPNTPPGRAGMNWFTLPTGRTQYTIHVIPNSKNLRALFNGTESMQHFVRNTDIHCSNLGRFSFGWSHDVELTNPITLVLREHYKKRAGFALCHIDWGSNSLFVDVLCAREKGAGIGSMLIDAIHQVAFMHGLKYVQLVTVPDPDTIKFYKKHGFKRGPPGATIGDRVRARALYKRIERGYNHPTMNVTPGNEWNGHLFNQNKHESESVLPIMSVNVKRRPPGGTRRLAVL